ncbi:hypothetical protein LCGC14_0570000 [marine sediment metagenome]|uniref:Uncharacterized protein n=1 Tax=marine sediment metagenome TaxID=412755 RepID=A0A0F9USS4_9ZZZZ
MKLNGIWDFCLSLILWILTMIIIKWASDYTPTFYESIVLLFLGNIFYQSTKKNH